MMKRFFYLLSTALFAAFSGTLVFTAKPLEALL
jgi:hypothetical protein